MILKVIWLVSHLILKKANLITGSQRTIFSRNLAQILAENECFFNKIRPKKITGFDPSRALTIIGLFLLLSARRDAGSCWPRSFWFCKWKPQTIRVARFFLPNWRFGFLTALNGFGLVLFFFLIVNLAFLSLKIWCFWLFFMPKNAKFGKWFLGVRKNWPPWRSFWLFKCWGSPAELLPRGTRLPARGGNHI